MQAALLGDAHTYHADVKDVAEIADQAGVKHLVLTHVMPSIMEDQVPQFTEGLADIFKGEISVGHDLARYGLE
jgi:ribonuclease Z